MPTRFLDDGPTGLRYLLEFEGVAWGAFDSCALLGSSLRPISYFVGDDAVDLRDLAGEDAGPMVVLAHGVAFDDTLRGWEEAVAAGRARRRDGQIVELDEAGLARRRWLLRGAWPALCEAAHGLGDDGERRIETLELAYDEIRQR